MLPILFEAVVCSHSLCLYIFYRHLLVAKTIYDKRQTQQIIKIVKYAKFVINLNLAYTENWNHLSHKYMPLQRGHKVSSWWYANQNLAGWLPAAGAGCCALRFVG